MEYCDLEVLIKLYNSLEEPGLGWWKITKSYIRHNGLYTRRTRKKEEPKVARIHIGRSWQLHFLKLHLNFN